MNNNEHAQPPFAPRQEFQHMLGIYRNFVVYRQAIVPVLGTREGWYPALAFVQIPRQGKMNIIDLALPPVVPPTDANTTPDGSVPNASGG